jgi:hypothetical protein
MQSRIDDIYLISRRESKRRFRSTIYEMWGSECAYCGKPARSLDHVIPRHKGGLTVIENLIPACLSCNGHKGAENWIEWFRKQDFYTVDREATIWLWLGQNLLCEDLDLLAKPFCGVFSAVEQRHLLTSYAKNCATPLNVNLARNAFVKCFHL